MEEQMTKNTYFVSFLGTRDYKPVCYSSENDDCVSFVQIATSKKYCPDIPAENYLIFCTDEAKKKNWENFKKEFQQVRGFELTDANSIHVPNGSTESELWEIFKIVAEKILENAEVIFDITHGFRSLPMIGTILFNYLKTTKNISVKGCYYGAFEAKTVEGIAPIFDLTPFYVLNDMTNAISLFEKSGNASGLVELGENNENIKKLAEGLKDLAMSIETCQLPEINEFNAMGDISLLIDKVSADKKEEIPPVKDLLEKIENLLEEFSGEKKLGATIKWCKRYGWVQQAFTIWQEAFLDKMVKKMCEELDCNDNPKTRTAVREALVAKEKWLEEKKWNKVYSKELAQKLYVEFNREDFKERKEKYKSVKRYRNCINHGGLLEEGTHRTRIPLDEILEFFKNF